MAANMAASMSLETRRHSHTGHGQPVRHTSARVFGYQDEYM